MAFFRVNKTKDFTVMSNTHLRDKTLSLKAKGLLSQMLSLPDEWDFSMAGLKAINPDGISSVETALKELREKGYLRITKTYPDKMNGGRIEYIYDIYEKPFQYHENLPEEKQVVEKQGVDFLGVENPGQYNTKESNTKKSSIKESSIEYREKPQKRFSKPTIEEVQAYCLERKNGINAKRFVDYYESKGWLVGKTPMKDWRAAVRTWESNNKKDINSRPDTGNDDPILNAIFDGTYTG